MLMEIKYTKAAKIVIPLCFLLLVYVAWTVDLPFFAEIESVSDKTEVLLPSGGFKAASFGAAFLVRGDNFLSTEIKDEVIGEWASGMNFVKAESAQPIKLMPIEKYFYVEHLGGLQNHVKSINNEKAREKGNAYVVQSSQVASLQCISRDLAENTRVMSVLNGSIGITTYWSGGDDVNNIRRSYFKATVCSLGRYFEHIVVAACTDFPRQGSSDLDELKKMMFSSHKLPITIIEVKCDESGFNLMSRTQRIVQDKIRAGEYVGKYVSFTDGDQIYAFPNGIRAAVHFLDKNNDRTVLVPHRLEEIYGYAVQGNTLTFPYGTPQCPLHGPVVAPSYHVGRGHLYQVCNYYSSP